MVNKDEFISRATKYSKEHSRTHFTDEKKDKCCKKLQLPYIYFF